MAVFTNNDVIDVLYPQVFFDGDCLFCENNVPLDKSMLYLNAKIKDDKNLYEEFINKDYYNRLQEIIRGNSPLFKRQPRIISTIDKDKQKRILRYSLYHFIYDIVGGLLNPQDSFAQIFSMDKLNSSYEEIAQDLKRILKNERLQLADILNNGKKSPYYSDSYNMYLNYIQNTHKFMTFEQFLTGRTSALTQMIVASKFLSAFFKQDINTDKLIEAFDPDKLMLIIAYFALNNALSSENKFKINDNCIFFVKYYAEKINTIKEVSPHYKTTIRYYDEEDDKIKTISSDEVIRDFEKYLARHPECRWYNLSTEEISDMLGNAGVPEEKIKTFDLQNSEDSHLLRNIISRLEEDRQLASNWEFIRRGSTQDLQRREGLSGTSTPLSEDEKVHRMLQSRSYLENTSYLYVVYGKNNFTGYMAYIYPSGAVIFEKYYTNYKNKTIASGQCTYGMNIYNFVELSKHTKTEIIKALQSEDLVGVRRIYHRRDMTKWKNEVERFITGSDYTDKVVDRIDYLVDNQELQKLNKKVRP